MILTVQHTETLTLWGCSRGYISESYLLTMYKSNGQVSNVSATTASMHARVVKFGRHKGLKIPRLNGHAGSSPAPGTN